MIRGRILKEVELIAYAKNMNIGHRDVWYIDVENISDDKICTSLFMLSLPKKLNMTY